MMRGLTSQNFLDDSSDIFSQRAFSTLSYNDLYRIADQEFLTGELGNDFIAILGNDDLRFDPGTVIPFSIEGLQA